MRSNKVEVEDLRKKFSPVLPHIFLNAQKAVLHEGKKSLKGSFKFQQDHNFIHFGCLLDDLLVGEDDHGIVEDVGHNYVCRVELVLVEVESVIFKLGAFRVFKGVGGSQHPIRELSNLVAITPEHFGVVSHHLFWPYHPAVAHPGQADYS